MDQWIRFGMQPVVVYSAYFANCRQSDAATSELLELAYEILQRASDEEKQCTGWEFINTGARYVKVFSKKCQYDDATVGLLMDNEIYSRPDEPWIVLTRGHFPEPFDDRNTAAITEEKIRDMKQRFRGTPSFSTEPSSTSWLAVTRIKEYTKVMDELAKVNPRSPSDNDTFVQNIREMVDLQMRHLGHALRYHNEQHPLDKIILQDVMRDVVEFETNRAAQNHFLCLLTLGTTMERHKTSAGETATSHGWQCGPTFRHRSLFETFDIPQGILIGLWYNVTIADEGARYTEKEMRFRCHGALKDFITTMTEKQSGTGTEPLHNFIGWDLALVLGDGRTPVELDVRSNEEPSWMQDGTQSAQGGSGTTPSEGTHTQPPPQTGTPVQPKRMPRPQQSGGASASESSSSAFNTGTGAASGPSEPERDEDWIPNVDWMKKKRPSRVEVKIHAAEDYAHHEQRISSWSRAEASSYPQWKDHIQHGNLGRICTGSSIWEDWPSMQLCPTTSWPKDSLIRIWLMLVSTSGWNSTTIISWCHRADQMQKLPGDWSPRDADPWSRKHCERGHPQQSQRFEEWDRTEDHWETLDGQIGWTGRTSEESTNLSSWLTWHTRLDRAQELSMTSRPVSKTCVFRQSLPAPIRVHREAWGVLANSNQCLELPAHKLTNHPKRHGAHTDLIHLPDQKTIENPCPRRWLLCQEIGRFHHWDQHAFTTSNLCQHLDWRSASWIPIFDCFHCWRDCNDDEEQRNSALHEWEVLETALRMWDRTLLLEARWGQRDHLGNDGEIPDQTEDLPALSAMEHNLVHAQKEECVHVKNTGFTLDTINQCTDHPRVIPRTRAGATTDAQTGSADIIGGMSGLEDSGQRRAWSDIRRGVFTPEPLDDMDEHWIEITETSEWHVQELSAQRHPDEQQYWKQKLLSELRQRLDQDGDVWDGHHPHGRARPGR